MNYYEKIVSITAKIQEVAGEINGIKKRRNEWAEPEKTYFWLGYNMHVTRKDGTTPPQLEGVKREALKAFDDMILTKQSQLEGLRFQLVNLPKDATS